MDDLDRALTRLAGAPVPPELDVVDAHVLARIGARRSASATGVGIGVVAVTALVMGVAGAGLPSRASAGASLAPLGGLSPLAPSNLLVADQ